MFVSGHTKKVYALGCLLISALKRTDTTHTAWRPGLWFGCFRLLCLSFPGQIIISPHSTYLPQRTSHLCCPNMNNGFMLIIRKKQFFTVHFLKIFIKDLERLFYFQGYIFCIKQLATLSTTDFLFQREEYFLLSSQYLFQSYNSFPHVCFSS